MIQHGITLMIMGAVVFMPTVSQAQTNLTLESAIRRALETHPVVHAASARVAAAQGARATAGRWGNPTLSYEVENASVVGRASSSLVERQVTAVASLPMEPAYQIGSRVARANAEIRVAEAELRDTRRRLALNVAEVFYRAALADIETRSEREVRDWLDSLVIYTRTRVEEGAAAESELIRLEVERGRAEANLALSLVEGARARATLTALVGLDSVRPSVDADAEAVDAARALPSVQALLALAKARRPDLIAADARLSAASAEARLERQSIVRELGVTAGRMTVSGMPALVAGVSVSFPVFDQNRGEIRRAEAARSAAAYERAATEREATAELLGTYEAVNTLSASLVRLSTDVVRRAEEGRRIAEGAYREGATSLLYVLDAARTLVDAQRTYYRTVFARRQSLIELNAALGADDAATITSVPVAEMRGEAQ